MSEAHGFRGEDDHRAAGGVGLAALALAGKDAASWCRVFGHRWVLCEDGHRECVVCGVRG